MQPPGTLYVIAAPSGAGKTSLVKALIDSTVNIQVSISYTTRPIRPGETEGKDYFFVDETGFMEQLNQGAFLEHAQVHQHYYGTSSHWVKHSLDSGQDVILEIDWQGAEQVRRLFPEQHVGIFILPPSRAALEERLTKRAQDKDEVIQQRLAAAKSEIIHYPEFDFIVINDDFNQALADMQAIVHATRLRQKLQSLRNPKLLKGLLA